MKKLYVDTRKKENKLSPAMMPYEVFAASDKKLYEGQAEFLLKSEVITLLKKYPEAIKILETI